MEHDITDKLKASILIVAQKQTKKRRKENRLCYLNNVEDLMSKFVGMSHFNNVTSSSSTKEKRAEKVVKIKMNNHHMKGISAK